MGVAQFLLDRTRQAGGPAVGLWTGISKIREIPEVDRAFSRVATSTPSGSRERSSPMDPNAHIYGTCSSLRTESGAL